MKKIIFIFVILTVLLFAGCDAMLEGFYPELTDNINQEYGDPNNIFAVEYYYNATDMLNHGYDTTKLLKVELYLTGDTPAAGDSPFRSITTNSDYYYYEFFVPTGSYDVWIWQDKNGNGTIELGDFVLSADKISPPYYNFTGDDEYWYYFGSSWDSY